MLNQSIPAFEWRPIMLKLRIAAFGIACFALGVQTHLGFAQSRPVFDAELMKTKGPTEAADFLLAEASRLAGTGSWERIAVGRAWYLGGRKEKGQEIFDSVTATRKVEDSDWFRIGRVYAEAGEWEKAQVAFDKALAMNPGDDSGMIEYGARQCLSRSDESRGLVRNSDEAKAQRVLALGRGRRLVPRSAAAAVDCPWDPVDAIARG